VIIGGTCFEDDVSAFLSIDGVMTNKWTFRLAILFLFGNQYSVHLAKRKQIKRDYAKLTGLICQECEYSLHGLPTNRCPECGRIQRQGEFRSTDFD